MPGEEAIKATIDELLKVLSVQNIVGEPIESEDKIIIPVTKLGLGFGTGMTGPGQAVYDDRKESVLMGAGGGIGVFPVAVVLIFKGIMGPEGVKVIHLNAPSPVSNSLSTITRTILERMGDRKYGKEKEPGNSTSVKVE